AALAATGTPVLAVGGNSFTGQVATFTDADLAGTISNYTAVISWGNGAITRGVVTQPGGVGTAFIVTGTQAYKAGSYQIWVWIEDAGGATATATTTAAVDGASLDPTGVTVSGGLDPASDSGISNHDNITNVVQPTFLGTSTPGIVVKLFASNGDPVF